MEDWMWTLVELIVGLTAMGLGVLIPFRYLEGKADIRWDIVGALGGIVFSIGVEYILNAGMIWTLHLPWVDRWTEIVTSWPFWLLLTANFIATDLGAYCAHRLLHTSTLWPTHAWHHSPKYLYWLAGLRGSPLHILIMLSPYYLLYVLFPSEETGLIGFLMILYNILNQHFLHSNVRVPFSRQIERVFVTPRVHFVHHSSNVIRTDSNYGFTFTCWDRMFGTYTDPDTVPANDELGLDYEADNWKLLLGLPSKKPKSSASLPIGEPAPGQ